jgi:hypothetical protein
VTDRRYYVSMTATCDHDALTTVLDAMQAAIPSFLGIDGLDGVSLSFTRSDADEFTAETVALPVTPAPIVPDAEVTSAGPAYAGAAPPPTVGPVVSTGPGAPPPDADPQVVTADEMLAPATVEQPTIPPVDDGQHAAPEEQP